MVKLAKKRNKGFKTYEINGKSILKFGLKKSGEFNFSECFVNQTELSGETLICFVALYAISDHKNKIYLNDELEYAACKLFYSLLSDKEIINLDEYKQAFNYYSGLMSYIFNMHKVDRKKAKKFGDPDYPTLDEVCDILEDLTKKGLLDENGKPINIPPYQLALWKQQLKEQGYDFPSHIKPLKN